MKYQFSTLYIDDDRRDLWGDELTQKASLSEGQQKPVYSTMFYFEDNQLIKTEDYPAFIINKNKLSYDKASKCKEAEDLKLFTSKLNAIEDYHDLVSFWMVKTNNHIGQNRISKTKRERWDFIHLQRKCSHKRFA